MRILLVEDEPLIAMDLESNLDSLGHVVVGVADTHDDALRLAAEHAPDAALVDVKLRDGFTGVDAARRLHSDYGLPCAFVTGNPEQVKGADFAIIAKPFTAADIAGAEILNR